MKCALHVHTSLSDATLSPDEVLKVYADLGFGLVAITDHEFLLRDNYVELVRGARHCGMAVAAGVEADWQPWNYHHLLRIAGERETLHVLAHPAAYYLEIEEVNERLASAPFAVDAVEITHRGFYTPKYDTGLIAAPKIATDDAHEPPECGRAWIETADTRDVDRALRAVKAGDFEVRFLGKEKVKRKK
jgi:DNA polymerase III alpha subunit